MRQCKNGKVYKKLTIGALLLVFCFIVGACGIQGNSDGVAVQQGGTSTENSTQKDKTSGSKSEKIPVYTMDPDTLEAEEMMVKMDTSKGLTAQMLVDAVLDLFEAQGRDIEVNRVEQNENTVIVDFNSEKPPVSGVGSAEETAILDCISMSLLDNLDDCQQVVFHVDGERYESGHYGFELNEAYKWKN